MKRFSGIMIALLSGIFLSTLAMAEVLTSPL